MIAESMDISQAAIRRYHLFVADLPCAHCGIEGFTQVCHENNMRNDANGNGMGTKSHWLCVMPLCCTRPDEKGCHAKMDQHELFEMFDDRYITKISDAEQQQFMVKQTIIAAIEAGILSP